MGGTRDIWSKSGVSLALKGESEAILNHRLSLKNATQSFNDQKLEIFTYSSGFKLGFEKVFTGQADKLHQGSGPFIVAFKPTPERVICI